MSVQQKLNGSNQQLLRHPIFVTNEYIDGGFKLVYQGQAADLYVDPVISRALPDS